jgi:protein involved in polysaccharide export with SLBB domain
MVMKPGQGRETRRLRLLASLLLGLLSGCAHNRAHLDEKLLAQLNPPAATPPPMQEYLVCCPDILDVRIHLRTDRGGRYPVGPDGRIALGADPGVRVEGLPVAAIAQRIADELHLDSQRVEVQVAEHRSQCVYLHGAVTNLPRSVQYQGPETVVDLLKRIGGITPGAEPGDIQVVRPRVAEGLEPQVFHVDLAAILLHNDATTNVRIQPFDQIYVGETRRGDLDRHLPPWLRPLYQDLFGLRQRGTPAP